MNSIGSKKYWPATGIVVLRKAFNLFEDAEKGADPFIFNKSVTWQTEKRSIEESVRLNCPNIPLLNQFREDFQDY